MKLTKLLAIGGSLCLLLACVPAADAMYPKKPLVIDPTTSFEIKEIPVPKLTITVENKSNLPPNLTDKELTKIFRKCEVYIRENKVNMLINTLNMFPCLVKSFQVEPGVSLLTFAIFERNFEIVKLLVLNYGADIDAFDTWRV